MNGSWRLAIIVVRVIWMIEADVGSAMARHGSMIERRLAIGSSVNGT